MKDGLKYIVGKRIAGVVVVKSNRDPRHQVFLVFPDGSRFEFWGENFSCCAGLDDAKTIQRYVDSGGGEIVWVYDEVLGIESEPPAASYSTGPEELPYVVKPPETLTGQMKRDLVAWTLAKAVIAKARGN